MKISILKYGKKEFVKKDDHTVMICDSTITLLQEEFNILVDTGIPGDDELIISELSKRGLSPDDIHFVINTHFHPDHVANNFLFKNATFIFYCMTSNKNGSINVYSKEQIKNFVPGIKIVPVPSHSPEEIAVFISGESNIVIDGGTIDSLDEIENPDVRNNKEYENDDLLVQSRKSIIAFADKIITGHAGVLDVKNKVKLVFDDNGVVREV